MLALVSFTQLQHSFMGAEQGDIVSNSAADQLSSSRIGTLTVVLNVKLQFLYIRSLKLYSSTLNCSIEVSETAY